MKIVNSPVLLSAMTAEAMIDGEAAQNNSAFDRLVSFVNNTYLFQRYVSTWAPPFDNASYFGRIFAGEIPCPSFSFPPFMAGWWPGPRLHFTPVPKALSQGLLHWLHSDWICNTQKQIRIFLEVTTVLLWSHCSAQVLPEQPASE